MPEKSNIKTFTNGDLQTCYAGHPLYEMTLKTTPSEMRWKIGFRVQQVRLRRSALGSSGMSLANWNEEPR